MQENLMSYDNKPPAAKPKQPPENSPKYRLPEKVEFWMQYNLTQEGFITRFGNVSNAIEAKARKILDLDKIEHVTTFHEGNIKIDAYICKPIFGYNVTAYTMLVEYIDRNRIVVHCNCQYCKMHNKMCSHSLALVIKETLYEFKNIVYRGGVRQVSKSISQIIQSGN